MLYVTFFDAQDWLGGGASEAPAMKFESKAPGR
jgi:hypothetical protein